MENTDEESEVSVSPRPAMTNAERMRAYRLRKKLEQEAASNSAVVNSGSGPVVNLEPIPGRSTDPVRFMSIPIRNIPEDVSLPYRGK